MKRRLAALMSALCLSGGRSAAQPQPAAPAIERIDESRIKLGAILIDRRRQEVSLPAQVNLTRGILEYYAVASGGKLHESVLKIDVEPSQLHLALLLAGFEPSEYGPRDPDTYARPLKKRGSLLRLFLKWTPESLGREQWLPASVWLYDRSINNAPAPLTYVFQGSVSNQGQYIADLDRSVIGLIPDESVVLATAVDKGNPYRGDAKGYEAHTSALPKKGTLVSLVIRPTSPQEEGEVEALVEELKRLKEAAAQQAQRSARELPAPPPFIINLPSTPVSSQPYEDRP